MELVERKRMKTEEERESGGDGGGRGERMEVLEEDLMMKVLAFVDARSLVLCLLVNRRWLYLASSDSLWSDLCEQLWSGKAHIPRWSKVPGLSKLGSYSRAIIDSKRTRIMKEDLIDHAWNFHFTECLLGHHIY